MFPSSRRIKVQVRDTAPTVLVTVGAVSSEAPWKDANNSRPAVLDRCHIAVSRRVRGRWTQMKEYDCPGWQDAWDVLDSLAAKGRRPYVVCTRASDVLTLLHWWDRVQRGELVIWPPETRTRKRTVQGGKKRKPRRHPLVIHGRPDIIGYSLNGCPYRWVSVTNWVDLTLHDLARRVGYPLPKEADTLDKWECPAWPAQDQARLMMHYMQGLMSWWLDLGMGCWKDTPGAAAWSTFLRSAESCPIITHAEEDILKLEDAAVFGGRASVFFAGQIGEDERWDQFADAPPMRLPGLVKAAPVHRLDVRAMYPSLLRDEVYPVKPYKRYGRISVQTLKVLVQSLCVVARVRVRTQRAELPRKGRKGTEYPVGQFDTVLTTGELIDALEHDEIREVWDAMTYTPGEPFREWAERMLSLRQAMKNKRDKAGEMLVKSISNSLGGRLGRKKQGWQDDPYKVPRTLWGEWTESDFETGELRQYRSLAGHVQVMQCDKYRVGTLGACYAHLTAYGRVFMSKIRALAGRPYVYWQDTDGIICSTFAKQRLEASGMVKDGVWGKLEYERPFHAMRFITPKHYWGDGCWVLAGIHNGFRIDGDMQSTEILTINPVRSAHDPEASAIYRIVRDIDITKIDPGVTIGDDGWVKPPHVWRGKEPPPAPKGQQWLIEPDRD